MVLRGVAREFIMVDINKARNQAEADDVLRAVPFAHPAQVRAGEYHDLADGRVVILAAGVSMRPEQSRLQLLGRHLGIDAQHVHGYVIGEHGDSEVVATFPLPLNPDEENAPQASAQVVCSAIADLDARAAA